MRLLLTIASVLVSAATFTAANPIFINPVKVVEAKWKHFGDSLKAIMEINPEVGYLLDKVTAGFTKGSTTTARPLLSDQGSGVGKPDLGKPESNVNEPHQQQQSPTTTAAVDKPDAQPTQQPGMSNSQSAQENSTDKQEVDVSTVGISKKPTETINDIASTSTQENVPSSTLTNQETKLEDPVTISSPSDTVKTNINKVLDSVKSEIKNDQANPEIEREDPSLQSGTIKTDTNKVLDPIKNEIKNDQANQEIKLEDPPLQLGTTNTNKELDPIRTDAKSTELHGIADSNAIETLPIVGESEKSEILKIKPAIGNGEVAEHKDSVTTKADNKLVETSHNSAVLEAEKILNSVKDVVTAEKLNRETAVPDVVSKKGESSVDLMVSEDKESNSPPVVKDENVMTPSKTDEEKEIKDLSKEDSHVKSNQDTSNEDDITNSKLDSTEVTNGKLKMDPTVHKENLKLTDAQKDSTIMNDTSTPEITVVDNSNT